MARRQKRDADPLELLWPLAGLLVLGGFFIPGFKQALGTLAIVVPSLLMSALVFVFLWRVLQRRKAAQNPASAHKVPHSETLQEQGDHPSAFSPVQNECPATPTTWTLDTLRSLEWKRFEDLIAAYSHELGYEAKTTRIGPDGGVDVLLYESGEAKPIMVIQCKAWNSYKVGVKPVRELFGVMAAEGVANGAFFTTNEFTSDALDFAKGKNLDLVDGKEFLDRLSQLPGDATIRLLAFATQGDYTTPTCPRCGVKMVLRTASKGSSEEKSFWGCRNYPRCKSTFKTQVH